jgi:hypothetical protein
MGNPFFLKCENCGRRIKKLNHFKDIFSIKEGHLITCDTCKSNYQVHNGLTTLFKIYNTFMWGLMPLNFLIIAYVLGVYFNVKGLFLLTSVSIFIYFTIELILTLFLPLKKVVNKD